jgi:hypothetical protein
MKSIDLGKQHPELSEVIALAAKEPVLLLTPDGQQFIISEADDFEAEVEALRNSRRFQQFLDQRMETSRRIPIEEIEAEIDTELKAP